MATAVSRRTALAAFGGLLAPKQQSKFAGVTVGVHTYSFRDRSLDRAIEAMVEIGVAECDLGGVHVEPPREASQPRYSEAMREWRLSVPLDFFENVGRQFRAAGIEPAAYTYNFWGGSDAEIERGFEMARALGAKSLAMSTRVSLAPQIDRAARRHKMRVGLHNHSRIQPDQLATPDDYAAALKGSSEYLSITLDVGHFTAAGFDPVDFVRRHHERVLSLHVKDRKRDQGPTVPLGEGDTPVIELLRFIRDKKLSIAAYIEHEYKAAETVAEMRKAFEYCKRALLS